MKCKTHNEMGYTIIHAHLLLVRGPIYYRTSSQEDHYVKTSRYTSIKITHDRDNR
jgi:hypothetical protein